MDGKQNLIKSNRTYQEEF